MGSPVTNMSFSHEDDRLLVTEGLTPWGHKKALTWNRPGEVSSTLTPRLQCMPKVPCNTYVSGCDSRAAERSWSSSGRVVAFDSWGDEGAREHHQALSVAL